MRAKCLWQVITVTLLLLSCKKEQTPVVVPPPVEKPVLLKDIVIPNLPSPYYHFEYNTTGDITAVSFASGLRMYDVLRSDNRISEVRNNTAVNKDRLQYIYDNTGKVSTVKYINEAGTEFRRCFLTYTGGQLRLIEWERKLNPGFAMERSIAFVYQADGNVLEITDHLFPVPGQNEATYVNRFEQYDDKVNTDGFSLIHDQNDHLLLLPGVQWQKNNPGKVIHNGNGGGYAIDYTYTYNDRKAPLTRTGDAIFTGGPNAGQRWQTSATYSYYP
ncbi:MAG: hypothetical protein JNN00_17875 [Chitinophagaceae bacterium]|nr:hypothetical protein [Chitinophagaceae bacterium]